MVLDELSGFGKFFFRIDAGIIQTSNFTLQTSSEPRSREVDVGEVKGHGASFGDELGFDQEPLSRVEILLDRPDMKRSGEQGFGEVIERVGFAEAGEGGRYLRFQI